VCVRVAGEGQHRGQARFGDWFGGQGAFTPDDARRLAEAAAGAHLGLRLHVDQLRDGGGALLAAELGAASADHLDYAHEDGIRAMARAGTVAVLLPGASLTLGGPVPPVAALRRFRVPTAIATDWNPGTSTVDSLVLCLALAARLYKMTPDEVFVGATEAAARSLRRAGRIGCLRPGANADVVIWDVDRVAMLAYHFGPTWAASVYKKGRRVFGPDTPHLADDWLGAM